MSKLLLSLSLLAAALPAFGADGTTLINQSIVLATGGYPFHITQSGSYRLSGNLLATNGGIAISANNVTLDFNGFTISCASNCGTVGVSTINTNITIENGTVTGFTTGAGIILGGSGRIDNMNVTLNGYGIGDTSGVLTLTNSNIEANNLAGLQITHGLIRQCTFSSNGTLPAQGGLGAIVLYGGVLTIHENNFVNNWVAIGLAAGVTNGGSTSVGMNTFGENFIDFQGAPGITSLKNNVDGAVVF